MFMPHWPLRHQTIMQGVCGIDENLTRVKNALEKIGNPQYKLPPTIHVAGTNGKGSTIAFLKSIFISAGYKVHVYTSPHIMNYNERIVLANKEIKDDKLYSITEEVRIRLGDDPITFFEGATVVALLAFARNDADILLVETGMGGRLDATNVLDRIIASVITSISEDHTEYLGDTLGKIAHEKAGIIKPHSPCVISWQPKEALEVIINRCDRLKVDYYTHSINWDCRKTDKGFDFIDIQENIGFRMPQPSLEGPHQIINASTAVATLRCIEGYSISYENIVDGISNTYWSARMEKITNGVIHSIIPDQWEFWIDGAHNNAGARMLSEIIKNWADKPLYVIHGRTINRDIKTFLYPLKGYIKHLFAVKVRSEPLSEDPNKIVKIASSMGFKATASDSIIDAVYAIKAQENKETRILVCGSLYLAGDVKKANL